VGVEEFLDTRAVGAVLQRIGAAPALDRNFR